MTEDDADNILRLNRSPEVMRYIHGEAALSSADDALEVLRSRVFPQYAQYGVGRWAVELRETHEFIGWCGLKFEPRHKAFDLGYRFLREHWGKGFATEAARASLNYGRLHLGGRRIVGMALVQNLASIHVLEKIGMRFERYDQFEGAAIAVYVAV